VSIEKLDYETNDEVVKSSSRNSLMKKYSDQWINQLYEKNFSEYIDVKKWAVRFYRENGVKPSVAAAASYFGVPSPTISVLKSRENLNNYFNVVSSDKETSLEDFLSSNVPSVKCLRNATDVVEGHTLDFYFPDFNFAVEIASTLTHHSNDFKNDLVKDVYDEMKPPGYSLNKALASEKAGVELFTIFDWMPWAKSLNMIKHKLSGSNQTVYGRKASVHFVDKTIHRNKKVARKVKDFIDENHVLGFNGRGSQFYVYLENNDEIIAASAWGKPRNLSIKNLGKERGTDIIELTRMCFKPGISIPGGASKMMKAFMRNYPEKLNSLITFSDYDLGFGNVYETLGFEMIEKPSAQKNYVHPILVKGDGHNEYNFRIKSSSLHFAGSDRLLQNIPGYIPVGMECQHEETYHPNGSCLPTNPQIVESYGFLPVYDCGYKKWRRFVSEDEQKNKNKTNEEVKENTLF